MAPQMESCKKMQTTDRCGLAQDSRRPAAEIKPQQETHVAITTMKLARLIAPALIGSSLTFAWPMAAADAPTVDSILAKHIAAVGGKEAMEKVHSRRVQFKVESETLGSSEGEAFSQTPDRERTHMDLTGAGIIDEGFDGTVAWSKNPWQGLRVKTGDELAKAKRDAQFHRELNFKSIYPDLAYKGIEKVGDEEAWLLESKPTATSKERFWFSTKTALLNRQESQFEGPAGTVNVTVLPQDYKVFDGLKFPGSLKMKIASGGQEFEITFKFQSVKHNLEMNAAKFAKPAE